MAVLVSLDARGVRHRQAERARRAAGDPEGDEKRAGRRRGRLRGGPLEAGGFPLPEARPFFQLVAFLLFHLKGARRPGAMFDFAAVVLRNKRNDPPRCVRVGSRREKRRGSRVLRV